MADDCPKCEEGLPPWLATFADLMSLLMCFFVLLLSFATVDAVRFKKMAESMKDAFGVQRQIPANEIVMGVSVIKQEWSPSVSEQAVITEIRQETSQVQREHLKMQESEEEKKRQEELQKEMDRQAAIKAAKEQLQAELAEQLDDLQAALDQEIADGLVTLERKESSIIVRIQEKGSFGSGSARLDPEFHEVMARISQVLASKPGRITVSGHTDNIPISTGRFRSNWELSSARAVTVLHSMLRNKDIAEDRVVVEGLSDTRPLVDNNSPQNRAKNRRVELIISRGIDEKIMDLRDLQFD
jgi:chemotaxis protein MotB